MLPWPIMAKDNKKDIAKEKKKIPSKNIQRMTT